MLKTIEKRLLRLEELAEYRREERLKHEPYYQVVPWCIMRDEVIVYYHPEGNYKPPEKYENLPFASVVEWAIENCETDYIGVSMASCAEWLFLDSLHDERYTVEQRERFKTSWLEDYPEFELLLTDRYWMKFAGIISGLPQQGKFHKP